MKSNNDIDKMTYEQAISELDEIVIQLETGKAPLEQSVDLYQRGVALTKHCQSLLNDAESKIMILADKNDGSKEEVDFVPMDINTNKESSNEST